MPAVSHKIGTVSDVCRLAAPILLASASAAANLLTDRIFLARYDSAALGAVLPAGTLANALTTAISVTIGYSATFVAQFHGGGDPRAATRAFVNGCGLAILSLPLFLLAIPAGRAILGLSGHDPELLASELAYFSFVQPAGFLAVAFASASGLLTGQGHTRAFGLSAALGALANIGLDRILIFGWGPLPALGIAGAGLASVLALVLQFAVLMPWVLRDPLLRACRHSLASQFDPRLMRTMLTAGLPNGLCSLVSAGAFALFALETGRLDSLSLSASSAVFAIGGLYYPALSAVACAVTILTARSWGLGDVPSTRRAVRSGLKIAFSGLFLFLALTVPSGDLWPRLFGHGIAAEHAATFTRTCRTLLGILALREIAETCLLVLTAALRGIGDTRFVMRAQCGIELLVWCPAILILSRADCRVVSLWLTMPLSFGLTALLLARRWRAVHAISDVLPAWP